MAEPTMADLMLRAARNDAAAYAVLAGHPEIHDSVLGFHAQQGIEKAIKSALFKRGVLVPRTHSIARLLDTLATAGIGPPPHADVLDTLDPFAVQGRYGALEGAGLIRDVVGQRLQDVLGWAAALQA